ncbi:MAG: transglycosylase SLT domain-containing protein [Nitrospiria bacterium]
MVSLFFLVILSLLILPIDAFSTEVYRYVDPSGTSHFTNVPTDARYQRQGPQRKKTGERGKYTALIEEIGRSEQIDPILIKAVIRVESNFRSKAVSKSGAQGLMQLMPATAKSLGVENPFDPKENIRGGTRYLRSLLDRFADDLMLALAAYHAGPGNVKKYGGLPPFKTTRAYVTRVLNFYEGYLEEVNSRSVIYKKHLPSGETLYTNQPDSYSADFFAQSKRRLQ